MGLNVRQTVTRGEKPPAGKTVTLAQRTYLDEKGKAVGKPGVSLLGREGAKIPAKMAEEAGVPTGKLGEKKPAAAKKATPGANKKATPARNKARKPAAKK